MNCSIIIRTLNEKKNLEILFKLLESQNNKQFEVILIDSGSTDGTIEFLDKYNFKFLSSPISIKKNLVLVDL